MSESPVSLGRRQFLRSGALGGLLVLGAPPVLLQPISDTQTPLCGEAAEIWRILRNFGGEFGPVSPRREVKNVRL
jgi:hypothetical protein